jgi:hypothetical protein
VTGILSQRATVPMRQKYGSDLAKLSFKCDSATGSGFIATQPANGDTGRVYGPPRQARRYFSPAQIEFCGARAFCCVFDFDVVLASKGSSKIRIPVGIAGGKREDAASLHREILKAAVDLSIHWRDQRSAIRFKKIQANGDIICFDIGNVDLCRPSATRYELGKQDGSRAANAAGQ